MKKIIEIARQFHGNFEGKDLYPKFFSWQWIFSTIFAIAFAIAVAGFFYALSAKNSIYIYIAGALVLATEIGFLLASQAIDIYKNNKQNERFNLCGPDVAMKLQEAKRRDLERLFGQKSSNFVHIAKEISELQKIKIVFMQPELGVWNSIFDPSDKSRLMSIILAAVALVAALIASTADGTELYALLYSDYLLPIALIWVWGTLVVHFLIYAIRLTYSVLSHKLMEWLLRLGWSKAANKLALNYLVTALVELHEPAKYIQRHLRPFDATRRRRAPKI